MSCPNFHKVHARNYYVVGDETTHYDEELDKDVPCQKESEDYEMDIDFACELGKEKGFEPKKWRSHTMDAEGIMDKTEWHYFGKKSSNMAFNHFEFSQEIYVQSGYYSGMNYDWDVCINDNFGSNFSLSEYDDVDSLVEDIADAWQEEASEGWNAGMVKIQKKNLKKWLVKMIDKFSDEADDMCRDICEDVYVCGGIFSNGEAIYYKEDSLKGKVNNVGAA